MPKLAFYKGKGDWIDWAVRLVTRSPYSHVELIPNPIPTTDGTFRCYSSSPRDGGVRSKDIDLKQEHWDLVPIDWYSGNVNQLFIYEGGAGYDYLGLVFSQFLNWRRHSKKRWFCSEIIATAVGLPSPQSYSPGSLKSIVEKLNQIHRQGLCEGTHYV